MVTIDNSPEQSAGGEGVQTQNPQQAPADLQPNQSQEGLQNVVSSPALFSNPQASAIINVPGVSGLSTQSLLSSEADNQAGSGQSNMSLAIVLIVAVFVIAVGSYFILQQTDK